ncbi:MAG: hypothetical protein OXC83_10500 [Chloroflexi bacterium]|nr:hypothetical protein [Chloroflexota bacterium]
MKTQSTGSLKGRLAGVLILLIALPILVLAPAFLADRYAVQSPSAENLASVQPPAAGVSDEPIHSVAATTDETRILSSEDSVVIVDDGVDFVRDAGQLAVTHDELDFGEFSGEVVFLDTKSEEGCVLTLRVYSGSNDEDILTGHIRIDDHETQSTKNDCSIFFLDEPNAQ